VDEGQRDQQGQPVLVEYEDRARFTVVEVDLDVDSNNDNRHDPPDRDLAEETVEQNAPGKIIILNADDDDANNTPDNQDAVINGNDDRDNDMADLVAEVSPAWSILNTEVVLDGSNYDRIRIFKQDGTLLVGPEAAGARVLAPAEFTNGILNLVVEGVELGEVTISLLYRQAAGGAVICRDDVLVTVRNDLELTPQWQRKDTQLVCVGALPDRCPKAGNHRWDVDHVVRGCDHEQWYCSRASISVYASCYGGALSQDRISHWAKQGTANDLGHNDAFSDADVEGGLSWALNNQPITKDTTPTWNEILDCIICYRPVYAYHTQGGGAIHDVVIDGFHVTAAGARFLHILDPWIGTERQEQWETYAISDTLVAPNVPGVTGRDDEPSVAGDGDGDGVMTFDEVNRFNGPPCSLDPNNPDSNGDGVGDKQEVANAFP